MWFIWFLRASKWVSIAKRKAKLKLQQNHQENNGAGTNGYPFWKKNKLRSSLISDNNKKGGGQKWEIFYRQIFLLLWGENIILNMKGKPQTMKKKF